MEISLKSLTNAQQQGNEASLIELRRSLLQNQTCFSELLVSVDCLLLSYGGSILDSSYSTKIQSD